VALAGRRTLKEEHIVQVPVDIRFRHVEPSEALESTIRSHVESLEQQNERITSCHVTVDHVGHKRGSADAHHRHGSGAHYRVSIHLVMPGTELFVGRDPAEHAAFEDPYAAVNEAFDAMRRQLVDLKRPKKGGPRIASAVN
jgi:ribosomal subunit interface protein